jgi:hypothetical protein
MAKVRVSSAKATPRRKESSVEASDDSTEKARKIPKQDAAARQARERARQRSGADD